MSHERGSVPAPEGDRRPHATPLSRLLGKVHRHFRAWPRRYVEMRVGRRRP
ncbi:hypothetical protein [Salinigranum halophilum]|uniref:hypothetical protein n=1 Tax=Salinigranum halophilum TaxID=2565931 RepID=UPI00191C5C40|nr:hypothetical protein [Salinigranum halophilum]